MRFKRKPPKKPTDGRLPAKDPSRLLGRMYCDYLSYTAAHKKAMVVQFDSVIGKKTDERAILTITFPRFDLQIGRVISKGDPSSALKAIKAVISGVIGAGYQAAFEACISDNGNEFATFYEIESVAPQGRSTPSTRGL